MSPFKPERIADLLYWIVEREALHTRSLVSRPPWTTDPILANNRFTNVRRMDDKVSRWLVANWYRDMMPGLPPGAALARAAVARMVNWPDTLDGIKEGPLTTRRLVEHLKAREAAGQKVWTGVYKVNSGTVAGSSRADYIGRQVDDLLRSPQILDTRAMWRTAGNLKSVDGIGEFMAGQIVADLRHVVPGQWEDRHSSAPVGPGSRRGIAWLQGWDGKTKLPKWEPHHFLPPFGLLLAELEQHASYRTLRDDLKLEAMDVQSALCEFDKFMRLRSGTGQVRNRYVPAT